MSRTSYDVKETYTGAGNQSAYTFDFKIEALAQLLVIEVDAGGVELNRVLGTDTSTLISSVTFDAVDGGGTVNLLANLTTNYKLIILLANDLPTQTFEFRNKTTFTLKRFESALDLLAGAIQRLSYRGKQAFRIHDLDDETTLNPQLPSGFTAAAGKVLKVNDLGTGMEYGPSASDIAAAANALSNIAIYFSTWASATTYAVNNVVNYNNNTYRCTTANSDVTFTESKWDRVNGNQVSTTQSIAAAGAITIVKHLNQRVKVQSTGGSITLADIAFGSSNLVDGMEIVIVGMDDTKTVTVPFADVQYGCILNGSAVLTKYSVLTVIYDATEERFIEKCRNF